MPCTVRRVESFGHPLLVAFGRTRDAIAMNFHIDFQVVLVVQGVRLEEIVDVSFIVGGIDDDGRCSQQQQKDREQGSHEGRC
jgi:hypothetical protein